MKKRILTIALAGALALSLAACGGNASSTSSSNPGGSSSQTDASFPDGSSSDGSSFEINPDESAVTLTLNKTDITLNKAGATFQLRYTTDPEIDADAVYTSSDAKVAVIDEKGVITAVAPGTATVTVECGGTAVSAAVTCDWKDSQPAPAPDTNKPAESTKPAEPAKPSGGSSSSSSSSGSSSSAPAPANVDLQSFYDTITSTYDFSFMMEADADMLSNFFAGLSDVSTTQRVVYLCGMSPSPHGDFALVQVSDSKDVNTVKAILQARIDYMVGDGNGPGGAFYPMEQTMWEENARIAVNGNYVMLIAHENCDDIVKEFNALF